jgi:hypothetical protein
LFSWIGNTLGGKQSVQEKLEKIEQGKITEEDVIILKAKLEDKLEDNEELQRQLTAKIKEVEAVAKQENVPMPGKTNTMNVTGNSNISLQDINSGGNISIGSA